ncbi:MAG: small-conductance mechanosensitive channel MscS [Parvularculaceae bacterium]
MPENLQIDAAVIQSLIDAGIAFGLKALSALAVLLIGLWIAGWAKKAVNALAGKSPRFDETLAKFFASIVYYVVLAFVVIAVLSTFGIQTTSLAALLGAAGLAIGLSLQGTLGHVAAGVMLLAFRPFKIGDFIEAGGHSGTVKAITLFTTELATPDNRQIIIPNGAIWGDSIVNSSAHALRRVDFVMGISYDDDIDKAIASLRAVIEADARALTDPEPQIVVGNLGDFSVDIIVRVWCNAADYWPLKFDFTKAFKERFDADGISIPFPTQIEIHQDAG